MHSQKGERSVTFKASNVEMSKVSKEKKTMQNNLQIYIYIYLVYSLYSMLHILICGICTISHTCFPQPFTLGDKTTR